MDKNPKNHNNSTPLHSAAASGHLSVCQLLIEKVADKNPKDEGGWTPLHYAAQNGHLAICQLIIENVEEKSPKDNQGRTPLFAVQNGVSSDKTKKEIIEYLKKWM